VKTTYNTLLIFVCFLLVNGGVVAQIKLQPSFGIGGQSIKYSSELADINGSSGINFGADFLIYINEDMALGGGVRFVNYSSKAVFATFESTENLVDVDGHSFELQTSSDGIEEIYSFSSIEIPIVFRYQQWVTSDIILFGASGPVMVIPEPIKSEITSGSVSTKGYYPQWKLLIDELDDYGYFTRDISGELPDVDTKPSLSWAFEVGAEYYIGKRINILLAAYYQSSFSSVKSSEGGFLMPDAFTYSGSLSAAEIVKPSKMGIRIGISLDITPVEKSSIKSIR
jgi:hypothetical protein